MSTSAEHIPETGDCRLSSSRSCKCYRCGADPFCLQSTESYCKKLKARLTYNYSLFHGALIALSRKGSGLRGLGSTQLLPLRALLQYSSLTHLYFLPRCKGWREAKQLQPALCNRPNGHRWKSFSLKKKWKAFLSKRLEIKANTLHFHCFLQTSFKKDISLPGKLCWEPFKVFWDLLFYTLFTVGIITTFNSALAKEINSQCLVSCLVLGTYVLLYPLGFIYISLAALLQN